MYVQIYECCYLHHFLLSVCTCINVNLTDQKPFEYLTSRVKLIEKRFYAKFPLVIEILYKLSKSTCNVAVFIVRMYRYLLVHVKQFHNCKAFF